jgi:putative spermidine/putrescine transport system permease protein
VVKRSWGFFGIVPLVLFFLIFLFLPFASILNSSLHDNEDKFTFALYGNLFHGEYAAAFLESMKLSLASMLLSGCAGGVICWSLSNTTSNTRTLINTVSALLANTGGIPLAFMFIAAFGQEGLIVKALMKIFEYDLYSGSFELFNFWGLITVYCFFQIPLMLIIFMPTVEHIRDEWYEANITLGGDTMRYLRYILIPIVGPAFLSSLFLLFGNAFSAFATAEAMTNGTIPLIPLLIGNLQNGQVISGQANQSAALAMGMIFISMFLFLFFPLVTKKLVRI